MAAAVASRPPTDALSPSRWMSMFRWGLRSRVALPTGQPDESPPPDERRRSQPSAGRSRECPHGWIARNARLLPIQTDLGRLAGRARTLLHPLPAFRARARASSL